MYLLFYSLNQYKRDVDFVINHTRKTLHSSFLESSDFSSFTTATSTTSSGGVPLYPVVRFSNNVVRVIIPETFSIEGNKHWTGTPLRVTPEGKYIFAERTQIPLTLAWAVTIHKSQGMTLDKVRMDLSSVFETGQAYVALSRVRDLSGLSLDGLNTMAIRANPIAVAFYRQVDEHVRQQFLQAVKTGEMKTLLRKYKRYFTRQKKIALAKVGEGDGEDVDIISFTTTSDIKDDIEGRERLVSSLTKEALEKDLRVMIYHAKHLLQLQKQEIKDVEIQRNTSHVFSPVSFLSQDDSQTQTMTSSIDTMNIADAEWKTEITSPQIQVLVNERPDIFSPSTNGSMSSVVAKSSSSLKHSPKRSHPSSTPIQISLTSTPSSSFSMLTSPTSLSVLSNTNSTKDDKVVEGNTLPSIPSLSSLSSPTESASVLTSICTSPSFELSDVSSPLDSTSSLSYPAPALASASPYPSSATLVQSGVMYIGALAQSLGLGSLFSLPQNQASVDNSNTPPFSIQKEVEEKKGNLVRSLVVLSPVISLDSQSDTSTPWSTQKGTHISLRSKSDHQEESPPPLEPLEPLPTMPMLEVSPTGQNSSPFALHSPRAKNHSSQKSATENFDSIGKRYGFRPPNSSFTQNPRKSPNTSQSGNISSPSSVKRQKKVDE